MTSPKPKRAEWRIRVKDLNPDGDCYNGYHKCFFCSSQAFAQFVLSDGIAYVCGSCEGKMERLMRRRQRG